MKRHILLILLTFPFVCIAQLPPKETKLTLCLDELKRVEKEWEEDRVVLEHQEEELLKLKQELAESRYTIMNLEEELKQKKVVREKLYEQALQFEKTGAINSAKDLFTLIINLFPKSFEAANSRVRLQAIINKEKNKKKK